MTDKLLSSTPGRPADFTTAQELRVLHVIAINGIGGAERFVNQLLPPFQAKGIAVHCLIFFQEGFQQNAELIGNDLERWGVEITYHTYRGLQDPHVYTYLLQTVARFQPTLVHSHLKHADLWLAVLKWRRKLKLPVITTIHGYRDQYQNQHGMVWNKAAKYSLYYWLTKFTYRYIDGYIQISKGAAALFQQAGLTDQAKTVVIHHGADYNGVLPCKEKPNNFELVIVGRLVRIKGHQFAIKALHILQKRFPQASLHFYGDGPEKDNLQQLAISLGVQNQVFFHGFVNDVHESISQHHIFLMTSIGEPFGLVFFDAFKAGLPVIAFDVPASNEIIINGENGIVVKTQDPEALAHAIENIFEKPHTGVTLAKNAILHLEKRFSLDRMIDNYISFYQKTVAKKIRS